MTCTCHDRLSWSRDIDNYTNVVDIAEKEVKGWKLTLAQLPTAVYFCIGQVASWPGHVNFPIRESTVMVLGQGSK